MQETIPQITNRYMNGKTLEAFAESLGIGSTKQSVSQWVNDIHEPSKDTLLAVFRSEMSTQEAKGWARECFHALTGIWLEPTFDLEIERRR